MSFLLSEIPVFLLIAGKGRNHFLISLSIFLVITAAGFVIFKKKQIPFRFKISYPIAGSLLSLTLAVFFFLRWHDSGRIKPIANFLKLPFQQTCILIALLLALMSLVGIDHLIRLCVFFITGCADDKYYEPNGKSIILFIMLTAFLTLFLNSRCSPLYPFNDWVDPNTMFTVGKGVLKGYVPYRDLYEQKGPMLIFLHTLGAAISYHTFLGIWIIELTACFAALFLIYKTTTLFYDRKLFVIIPFIAAVIYGTSAFRAGDSAEEYCLPLTLYALYVGIKVLKNEGIPKFKEFFLIGITSGCIFWMKYSLIGFHIGWALFFFFYSLYRKKIIPFIKGIFFIIAGVLVSGIPSMIYFGANSALKSFFESYFYNNLFLYSNDTMSFDYKMLSGYSYWIKYSPLPMYLSCFGMLWALIKKNRELFFMICLTFISTYLCIFIAGTNHGHTSFALCIFSFFGIWNLLEILKLIISSQILTMIKTNRFSGAFLIISLILLVRFSYNMKFLEFPKEKMFQFQMKDIIERSHVTNPTVFYYKIGDAGVNTVAGLIPELRFFCDYNNSKMTEISEVQSNCIENQCADFIISRSKFENFHPDFHTYDYQGWIVGMADETLEYYHYFTPKKKSQ